AWAHKYELSSQHLGYEARNRADQLACPANAELGDPVPPSVEFLRKVPCARLSEVDPNHQPRKRVLQCFVSFEPPPTVSRTSRFLRGLGIGYLNLVITTVAGFFLTRFYLHHLGQVNYGYWLVASQLLGFAGLLDLGVVALLPREVAYVTG